jgi:CheY-like chemotaxis protein
MSVSPIVVVEDNPADVLLLEEALKHHGVQYVLERFTNGEDAAKAISVMAEAPALFILDLNVPRVHGLELLRLIRACPPLTSARVAILTSSQAASDKTQSEQFGADAYIVKPMGYNEFVTNVGGTIVRLLSRGKAAGCCRIPPWPPFVRCRNRSMPPPRRRCGTSERPRNRERQGVTAFSNTAMTSPCSRTT